jgi:indolepyruvate ferredoxin oxidoreductase
LWAALKVVSNVADAVGSVDLDPRRVQPVPVTVEDRGRTFVHVPSAEFLSYAMLEMERSMLGPRLAVARAYASANGLNRVVVAPPRPWLGIVAAGAGYYDLREALHTLGLGDDELRHLGVRLIKLDVIWPLDPPAVRDLARDLEEIIVVEDKGPFVETSFREALYALANRPRVLGKTSDSGGPLFPAGGLLSIDAIARGVGTRLQQRGEIPSVEARLSALDAAPRSLPLVQAARLPFFCSGCPHNLSTEAPDDALVGAGIGCHGMITIHTKGKGIVTGLTQMGGEGAQWIGQAPFVESQHFIQNLGDGTFQHSGSLALRASVAAGVNITYKILYNRAVAMTGGQDVQGAMSVPDLTRWLKAEGVRRIVVTTDEPERYRHVKLADIASVHPRGELMALQESLRREPGVTVLIHDQACAAEQRRLRKRGKLPEPAKQVAINERVCEGCGDCTAKSNCLSLLPIRTEFGYKTQIEQTSCNKDYSCLEGDCPSFVTVTGGRRAGWTPPTIDRALPEPEMLVDEHASIRLMGIGGTGVVTVAQVIGMAALLDGKRTVGLDQTGLAQKAGPVVSDVRIVPEGSERASHPAAGGVDCYICLDLLGAASAENLDAANPASTIAVISTSKVPTAGMLGAGRDDRAEFDAAMRAIEERTKASHNVYLDAQRLAERLFRDGMMANILVLGAAWQRGLVPLTESALIEAIHVNGVAVDKNIAAFEWGRAVVAYPDLVRETIGDEETVEPSALSAEARALVDSVHPDPGSELERLLEIRVADLIAYQNVKYARRYADAVRRTLEAERAAGGHGAGTELVAHHLHRLMAYKDEYEVARLHLDPDERQRLVAQFGEGAKIRYQLHPPALRALGMKRKISLGPWFDPAFRALRFMRRLRGTPFDVFGLGKVRRLERSLPSEYLRLVARTMPEISTSPETVLALLDLPADIRGYEHVKLRNVDAYRTRVEELEARLHETSV